MGTVPRAYEGMEGRTNKNNEIKNSKILIQKQNSNSKIHFFKKPKFHYKPNCEVGCV
jgi:hypothetical protein